MVNRIKVIDKIKNNTNLRQSLFIMGLIQLIQVFAIRQYVDNTCLYDVILGFSNYCYYTVMPIIPYFCLSRIKKEYNANYLVRIGRVSAIWKNRIISIIISSFEICTVMFISGIIFGKLMISQTCNWKDTSSYFFSAVNRTWNDGVGLIGFIAIAYIANYLLIFTMELLTGLIMWITDNSVVSYILSLAIVIVTILPITNEKLTSLFDYNSMYMLMYDIRQLFHKFIIIFCYDILLIYVGVFIKKKDFLSK